MRNLLNEDEQLFIKSVLIVVKLAVTNPVFDAKQDGAAIESLIDKALGKL